MAVHVAFSLAFGDLNDPHAAQTSLSRIVSAVRPHRDFRRSRATCPYGADRQRAAYDAASWSTPLHHHFPSRKARRHLVMVDAERPHRLPHVDELRGWITEEDEQVTLGPEDRPIAIAVRGYNDSGDATENFNVDPSGGAHWKTVVDSGTAAFGDKRYNTYGGPWLESELDIKALIAAGDKGVDLLPTGHASISVGPLQQIEGGKGTKSLKLAFVRGFGFSPSPMWLDGDNRFFGFAGDMAVLPEGYETYRPNLKVIQDKAIADMSATSRTSSLPPPTAQQPSSISPASSLRGFGLVTGG